MGVWRHLGRWRHCWGVESLLGLLWGLGSAPRLLPEEAWGKPLRKSSHRQLNITRQHRRSVRHQQQSAGSPHAKHIIFARAKKRFIVPGRDPGPTARWGKATVRRSTHCAQRRRIWTSGELFDERVSTIPFLSPHESRYQLQTRFSSFVARYFSISSRISCFGWRNSPTYTPHNNASIYPKWRHTSVYCLLISFWREDRGGQRVLV